MSAVRYQTKATGWTLTPARRNLPDLGRQARTEIAEGRYEDYVWLRTEQHLTIRQAAERLGITVRHAQRYERRRKAVTQ